MLIGALKLFLHLILFIWSLIQNMSLHSAKEEEEAKDIFHLPRNFYLWINQWNNPSLTNILLKKKRKLLNLKSKAEFFWVVQTFKDKRQISQRLRFQISSKKKLSLTGWTQLIKKKKNLLKIKRLGHWYRCSRLWMTKAFYKNVCNIILISKLLMTIKIKKDVETKKFQDNSIMEKEKIAKKFCRIL